MLGEEVVKSRVNMYVHASVKCYYFVVHVTSLTYLCCMKHT